MKKLSIVLALLLVAALIFGGVTLGQKGDLQKQMDTKVSDLQKQLDDKVSELTKAVTENDTLKADKSALEEAKAAAETALSDLTAEKDAAIAGLEEKLTAAASDAQTALADAAAQAQEALASLTAQKDEALASLTSEKDTAIAGLEEKLTAAAAEAEAALTSVKAQAEEAIASLTAEKDAALAAADEAKTAAQAALTDAKAEAEKAIASLTAEKDATIAGLEEKLTAAANDAEAALAAAAAKAEEALAAVTGEKDEAEKALAAANDTVAVLENQVASMGKMLDTSYAGKTVILHTNDVHGALEGYAYIAKLRDWFKALGASNVILVDAGDFTQGTPYVSSSKGAAAVEMMNAVGYDIVTLGNHEFDFGYAQLMDNLSKACFTTISANVFLDETDEPMLPPAAIYEAEGGLKIGFVGLETPETATKVNPGLIKEIHFAAFDNLYTVAQAAVDKVRGEADLVIGLWHLGVDAESAANGYRSIDVLSKVTGVDFVIDAHSHTVMTEGENGEPVQSTGTQFANVGVVVIDNETKQITEHYLYPTQGLAKDEAVAAKAREIMDEVDAKYSAVFATSEVELNGAKAPGNRTEETNLGDLITDAMVWSVVKEGGIEQVEPLQIVGITNGGGIRATIKAGDVTMKDINTVLPFGNTVAVVYVTGEELLEALEASTFCTPNAIGGYPQTSGITWTLDVTKEFDKGEVYVLDGKETSYYAPASINRVTIESVNGEPFDPAATYAVVTNDFCAAGGDTYNCFARAYSEGNGFDTGIPMDEAVMAYVSEVLNGAVTAEAYGAPRGSETQIK